MEYSPAPQWVKLYAVETEHHSRDPRLTSQSKLTVMSDIDGFARSENGGRSGISETSGICGGVVDLDRKH